MVLGTLVGCREEGKVEAGKMGSDSAGVGLPAGTGKDSMGETERLAREVDSFSMQGIAAGAESLALAGVVPPAVHDSVGKSFVRALTSGAALGAYFQAPWVLEFHADNRCEGSTDADTSGLRPAQIDSVIPLAAMNDGDGWTCKERKASSFLMKFSLKARVREWDRKEMEPPNESEPNVIYIHGGGESDYLKLLIGADGKVFKLEYRSEDPG